MQILQAKHEFEKLAGENLDAVYTHAIRLTHDTPQAEQLVQSTFSKALQTFHDYQKNKGFCNWLFEIMESTVPRYVNDTTGNRN